MMGRKLKETAADARLESLAVLITELQEEPALALLATLLHEGVSPALLLDRCLEGMHRVGKRFEEGRYFIAALIMAGEIMREASEMLGPHLSPDDTRKTQGKVLLATVQGDIHDLGKNLFADLLHFDGVEVVDLGVDVLPARVLEQTREKRPDMVGLSCVLTSCLSGLKETIALLHEDLREKRPPVIIGGACVDEKIREFCNADYWAADVALGLNIYRKLFRKG